MIYLDPEEKQNKTQYVYEAIKAKIIDNTFLPGTMLLERELAEKYPFSRTPIRNALAMLANDGFVKIIPNKGVFVSEIEINDVVEIYEMRTVLDALAVRLCIRKLNDLTVNDLERLLKQMKDAYNTNNYWKGVQADLGFHARYAEGAQNTRLESSLSLLNDQLNRVLYALPTDMQRNQQSIIEHENILNAIKQRNAELAEQIIVEHMQALMNHHIELLIKKLTNGASVSQNIQLSRIKEYK